MDLKCGQVILVEGKKYSVNNCIEYQEDSWKWKEYELVDYLTKELRWLCVEEVENGAIEYSIFTSYDGMITSSAITVDYQGQEYRLYEQGTARVSGYQGANTDVDIGETYDYKDFMTEDEEKVISYENWDGDVEKSIGYYLEPSDVVVTDEIDYNSIKRSKSSDTPTGGPFIPLVFMLIVLGMNAIPFFGPLMMKFSSSQIKSHCDKNLSYTYVTSVSNTMNKSKARVYKTKFYTLDTCARDIIDALPENITKVNELATKDGIAIETYKEYAYIYREVGKVFVQVSPKSFVSNEGGSTYHSSHSRRYYSAFRHKNYSPRVLPICKISKTRKHK